MTKRPVADRSGVRCAVIYTRVSTEVQGEGYSLTTQLQACRSYAAEQRYVVAQEFEDQHTGTEIDRPGLNALLEFIRSQTVDVVIVYDIDRLSRSAANQAILEMELAQQGARVEYVVGRYADTPEGDLTKLIKAAIAQYENRQRAERSLRGRKGKARAGYVVLPNLRTPYGYDLVTEPHKAWLVINEVEAPVVRKMFAMVLDGWSTYSIARELTKLGILTRGDQRGGVVKRAAKGAWDPGTVRSILSNTVHKGTWTYNKVNTTKRQGKITTKATLPEEQIIVPVPAIVDTATWEAAQVQLQRNKQFSRRNAKRNYLLRGLVRCRCGRVWLGSYKSHLKRAYYRCSSAEKCDWLQDCTIEGGVRQERLEEAVWSAVANKLLNEELLRFELAQQRTAAAERQAALTQRLTAIDVAITDIHRKLGILLDQVLVGGFTTEVIDDRRQILLAQLRDLQGEEIRIQAAIETVTLNQEQESTVFAFAEQVRAGLRDLTFEGKRQVLELLQVQVDALSQTEFRVTALIPIDGALQVPRAERSRAHNASQSADGSVVRTLTIESLQRKQATRSPD